MRIFELSGLRQFARQRRSRPFLIDQLIPAESVNILVGKSNLGKTPLAVQLGLSLRAGKRFLGQFETLPGRTLYITTEGQPEDFISQIVDIGEHLQGSRFEQDGFGVWSPNWDEAIYTDRANLLERALIAYGLPDLVVLDPLRGFFPEAEESNAAASEMVLHLRGLSRTYRCAWLILHHRRKELRGREKATLSLQYDPHEWLEETAGAGGLVNLMDLRLGIEPVESVKDHVLLGGYLRRTGPLTVMKLERVKHDERPVAYRLADDQSRHRQEERPKARGGTTQEKRKPWQSLRRS